MIRRGSLLLMPLAAGVLLMIALWGWTRAAEKPPVPDLTRDGRRRKADSFGHCRT